jgi:o-succinylbenzoate synthase
MLAGLVGRSLAAALGNLERQAEAGTFPASLICGVESALLDALARHFHVRLGALLSSSEGSVRKAVPVNAIIGEGSLSASIERAAEAVASGYSCIKLKVGGRRPEQDIELVRAVREAIGPDVTLRLDANGRWSLSEAATVLSSCQAYDLQFVEQPLAPAALHELPALLHQTGVPIALDEALADPAVVHRILESRYADVLVIKPQVVGGLQMSQKIIQAATQQGIECVLTSSMESGIGIAATLQLAAALPELRLASGLATLPLLVDDLIQEALPVHAGAIATPQAPGLGVTLDEPALARYGA